MHSANGHDAYQHKNLEKNNIKIEYFIPGAAFQKHESPAICATTTGVLIEFAVQMSTVACEL